jgi:hypothetical protein
MEKKNLLYGPSINIVRASAAVSKVLICELAKHIFHIQV